MCTISSILDEGKMDFANECHMSFSQKDHVSAGKKEIMNICFSGIQYWTRYEFLSKSVVREKTII